ncbi:MAG: hypothetical protein R3C18_19760 [Planctomycetaceae bacterium]
MSYDLFLGSPDRPLTSEQFMSFFEGRPHYDVSEQQAVYENETTGVYFCFDFSPEDGTVAFNLNYFRPHFFGLEAAPEVAAFVEAFDLDIHDPQHEGMEDGPFSVEGFLQGWNTGNRFGYRAILTSHPPEDTHVYPTTDLERIWRWNYRLDRLQEQEGEMLFVPRYMFITKDGVTRSMVVWPDAIPILIPQADFVYILRDELSLKPQAEDHREMTLVKWDQVESLVSSFPFDGEAGCYRLDYASAPLAVVQHIQSLPIHPLGSNVGLSLDRVLNAEIVRDVLRE